MGYKAPTGSVTDNLNLFFRDLDDCLLGFRGVLSQWEDTFKDKISKVSNGETTRLLFREVIFPTTCFQVLQ